MKVVLFCGGLGTRIREYSESIPKPMIPVGHQPIMWHIMQYYSQYGHRDFVLCLGYKANIIKDFFLNYRPQSFADCVVSQHGEKVEFLSALPEDWRVSLIDTGIWRNIGERLWAVRDHVKGEEMFLANYSDGLSDVNLNEVIDKFKRSGKIACFLAIRPPLTYHLVDMEDDGRVREFRASDRSDIWINGGYFILRPQIFDYMRPGEELVLEPFKRLIADNQLMAFKHEGFWRSMDTLRDRQLLEDLVEKGNMPWVVQPEAAPSSVALPGGGRMRALPLARPGEPLSVLCLGAHSDDIEIGAGGTILGWLAAGVRVHAHWCVLSASGARADEAAGSANAFLEGAAEPTLELKDFRDGYFPHQPEVKDWFEDLRRRVRPDVVLTHRRDDAHQDHRHVCNLTWNSFRDHLILEYEIPKWDGDTAQPNVYMPLAADDHGAQDGAAAPAFRHAALQGLVRRRDLSRPRPPARHGMPGARALRRRLRDAQGGAGLAHDREKWTPVFPKNRAKIMKFRARSIPPNPIPL